MEGDGATILTTGGHFGFYRVLQLLGAGGMGEVYLVEDECACAKYAVKVLNPAAAEKDAGFIARFIREAEVAMDVCHPNLVTVHDAGRDPETGLCYSVMELLPGGTLRDALKATPGGFPIAGVISVASDLARALACIEDNGFVHRDLKPENVLFAQDGTAKLADLGIVRSLDPEDVEAGRTTEVQAVVGTPAYMSPEQMLDSRQVDIRSDIYSLGLVIYEMITGYRPNEGQTAMGVLAKALDGQTYPDVREVRPDVPPELAALLSSMLAPSPDARPATAGEVLDRLTDLGRPPPSRPAQPLHGDRSLLFAVTALILAVCALAVAVFAAFGGET